MFEVYKWNVIFNYQFGRKKYFVGFSNEFKIEKLLVFIGWSEGRDLDRCISGHYHGFGIAVNCHKGKKNCPS